MHVRLVQVPYHLGHEGVGMGAGPDRLAPLVAEALRRAGHDVELTRVPPPTETSNEIAASFDVVRGVADQVREGIAAGAFPLALSGNCFTSVGVVAGLELDDLGVVWLDAHPDFNTAEGTTSGFQDGMALSILTGTGWDALRATIPGYRALREEDVVLVGTRDASAYEEARLRDSPVAVVAADDVAERLESAIHALRSRLGDVYLHLDLDVLDPSEGRANEYAAPGGLRAEETRLAIEATGRLLRIRAATLSAYDPNLDPAGTLADTATKLVTALGDAASIGFPRGVPA